MPATIYLETTVISYLTARPSRDVVAAGHQQVTRDWWDTKRHGYSLHISPVVLAEAQKGDPIAAQLRLEVLAGLPQLDVTVPATELARFLVEVLAVPATADVDALHIAVAAVHGMDFLLTWNCSHIANANLRLPLMEACSKRGYRLPVICTPDEMVED